MQKEKEKEKEPMAKQQAELIIEKLYSEGDIQKEELDRIRTWLAEEDNSAIDSDVLLRRFIDTYKYERNPKYAPEMWQEAAGRLGLDANIIKEPWTKSVHAADKVDKADSTVRRPLYRRTLFRVAAVLIPIFVAGAALLVIQKGGTTEEFATVSETVPEVVPETVPGAMPGTETVPEIAMVSVFAAIAQDLTLPDGSTVSIKSGSTVTYPEDFSGNREVSLDGEAFFSVRQMNGKPFMVKSNSITVTVYGTEFSVKAFNDDNTAEVKLASGSVAVNGEGIDETFMTPGQRCVFDKTHRTITLEQIGEGELLRLRRLNLSLDMQTLDEAFGMMSQYFGVKIKASTELDLTEQVGINFDDEVTLEEALSLLQTIIATPFDYSIASDTVKITKRR